MKEIGLKIDQFCQTYFNELTAITKEESMALEPNDAFVLNVIDNAVENFSGAGQLLILSEANNFAYFKNSASVLLRKSLSDIIVLCWIYQNDEEVAKKIIKLREDHPKYHISYLKKMLGLGLMEFSELKDEVDILNKLYGDLLGGNVEYDFSNYTSPKSQSISHMLDEETKQNPFIVDAYKAYNLFSKLEHSGEFSRLIMNDIYQTNSEINKYIESAIFTIEKTLLVIVSAIFKDYEIKGKLSECKIIE